MPQGLGAVTWLQAAPVALILAGTGLAVVTSSRLAAAAGLGVVGVGAALVFLLFGAPDVAITQLLVETLTVVLLAVALLRLPRLAPDWRPGHAALSAAVGAIVALALLAVLREPFDRRLSDWFETASWPEAHGRNIVNVILVDFRALDTFGEIVVVAVAAVAALALLRAGKKP
jgi:multicomponent Na+:H+ antiporter subunit A